MTYQNQNQDQYQDYDEDYDDDEKQDYPYSQSGSYNQFGQMNANEAQKPIIETSDSNHTGNHLAPPTATFAK